jgi:hypothetical protein
MPVANHVSRGSIDNKSELFSNSNGSNMNKNALEGMLSSRTTDVKTDPKLSSALNNISARTF